MNRFTFFSNVVAALLLATIGAALQGAIQPFLGNGFALRMALLGCASAYLAFLLLQLRPRFGIALVVSAWLVLTVFLLVINPHLLVWLSLLLGSLWLMRCVLRYQHILHGVLDGVINGVAACVGLSVMVYTHSLWLALWSYFLALAFCVVIPARQLPSDCQTQVSPGFQAARSSAENALRRLQKQTPHSA